VITYTLSPQFTSRRTVSQLPCIHTAFSTCSFTQYASQSASAYTSRRRCLRTIVSTVTASC